MCASSYCIYGFYTEASKNKCISDLEKYITKTCGDDKTELLICGSFDEPLRYVNDCAGGTFECLGICLYESDEYTLEHKAIQLNELAWIDEKLKNIIKTNYPQMNYDEMVNLFGEPKIHIFMNVS